MRAANGRARSERSTQSSALPAATGPARTAHQVDGMNRLPIMAQSPRHSSIERLGEADARRRSRSPYLDRVIDNRFVDAALARLGRYSAP